MTKLNPEQCCKYIVEILTNESVRHSVHRFSSGAIMIDVWLKDLFFDLQFTVNYLGFSLINENTGFDTTPDEKFYDLPSFEKRLLQALNVNATVDRSRF